MPAVRLFMVANCDPQVAECDGRFGGRGQAAGGAHDPLDGGPARWVAEQGPLRGPGPLGDREGAHPPGQDISFFCCVQLFTLYLFISSVS